MEKFPGVEPRAQELLDIYDIAHEKPTNNEPKKISDTERVAQEFLDTYMRERSHVETTNTDTEIRRPEADAVLESPRDRDASNPNDSVDRQANIIADIDLRDATDNNSIGEPDRGSQILIDRRFDPEDRHTWPTMESRKPDDREAWPTDASEPQSRLAEESDDDPRKAPRDAMHILVKDEKKRSRKEKAEREPNNRESLLSSIKEKFKLPKFKAAARNFMHFALIAIAAVSLGFAVGTKKASTADAPQVNISIDNDFSPSIEVNGGGEATYNYNPSPEQQGADDEEDVAYTIDDESFNQSPSFDPSTTTTYPGNTVESPVEMKTPDVPSVPEKPEKPEAPEATRITPSDSEPIEPPTPFEMSKNTPDDQITPENQRPSVGEPVQMPSVGEPVERPSVGDPIAVDQATREAEIAAARAAAERAAIEIGMPEPDPRDVGMPLPEPSPIITPSAPSTPPMTQPSPVPSPETPSF